MPLVTLAFPGTVFLVQTPDGSWQPGIGDPTFMGWVTVLAYFWAAYGTYKAFRLARRRASGGPRLAFVWALLCAGMLALGINKQLDLQSLFTVILRNMAKDGGWYEQRHAYQGMFIKVMAVFAVAFGGATLWLVRKHLREVWLAGLGGVFLAFFVIVRAASFHHVDMFLGDTFLGLRMNWIFELSGIACVGFAASRYRRRRPS